MIIKQRVHELSKAINVSSKELMELLAQYDMPVKNHMALLEETELDLIFEYYTQKNAVEEIVFPQKKEEEKPQEPDVSVEEIVAESEEITGSTVRYVETRQSTADLDKIDANEKIEEELAPVESLNVVGGKQKIKKNRRGEKQDHNKKAMPEKTNKEKAKPEKLEIMIPDEISVGDLAERLGKPAVEVIKKLMMLGIMAAVSQTVDYDTAALVAEDFGATVTREIIVTEEDKLFQDVEDAPEDLKPRSPVVVVMGHVDHGKTSLLDAIRDSNVTATEAGGITQHIGACRVRIHDQDITFLDTPGHEAFTAMRARGAQVTDIAVLVVAADDGIMPQTIEAINHAKAANISIIVAINKIDKPTANPDRVMQELTEHGLVPEIWGGDTICVNTSAKNRTGIDDVLEMILLVAEMRELKANPDRMAKGTVIESRLDKGRGPVATVLVQNGTLKSGDIVVAGTAVGRVRVMVDDKGRRLKEAGPSVPVEITGLSETPEGGDIFYAVSDERKAREVVEARKQKIKSEAQNAVSRVTLDNLFDQIKEGEMKELSIILKADVQGSVEAMRQSLEKLSNDEVRVRVIHGGVGTVTESDVMLATASNAIIIGFNVRPTASTMESAKQQGADIRLYRVIYQAIEEMEAAMKGMLAPQYVENVLGHAQVRQTFKVSGVGTIAGCYVTDGKIVRNSEVRIVRDGIVIHEGKLNSLKRFKDDVKEVANSYECGLGFENFNDIKEQDVVECFVMEEVAR